MDGGEYEGPGIVEGGLAPLASGLVWITIVGLGGLRGLGVPALLVQVPILTLLGVWSLLGHWPIRSRCLRVSSKHVQES